MGKHQPKSKRIGREEKDINPLQQPPSAIHRKNMRGKRLIDFLPDLGICYRG